MPDALLANKHLNTKLRSLCNAKADIRLHCKQSVLQQNAAVDEALRAKQNTSLRIQSAGNTRLTKQKIGSSISHALQLNREAMPHACCVISGQLIALNRNVSPSTQSN